MDRYEIGVWALLALLVIGAFYAGSYAATWVGCLSSAGQKYDVTVTVQASERSTRFGDHTNVWVRVYGEQDITYKLIGFHEFEVGKTYHIVFINEQYRCCFIVWWFETRGRIQTIEQVTSPYPSFSLYSLKPN